jgi:putative transposase
MPEHVHLVLIPPVDIKLRPAIGDIKRLAADWIVDWMRLSQSGLMRRLIVERDGIRRMAVWQRRCYDHNCRSEEAMWEKVRYCHNNPVKRELVNNPADWVWSSYRWYHGLPGVVLDLNTRRICE